MNQINNYVEAMFSSLPKTKEIVEMKINIIENMEEKFKELLSEGKNENEAIGIVISQFGSIDELKKELSIDDFNNKIDDSFNNYSTNNINSNSTNEELKKEYFDFKKKTPFFYAAAVMLYILAPLFFLIAENIAGEDSIFSYIGFFSLIAIATGIFVYFGSRNSQHAKMLGLENNTNDDNANPFNGFIFTIATAIFLILGFTKDLWHPGWIVFIIASAIATLLDYFYKNKKTKKI